MHASLNVVEAKRWDTLSRDMAPATLCGKAEVGFHHIRTFAEIPYDDVCGKAGAVSCVSLNPP